MSLSVVIPAYDRNGEGAEALDYSFSVLSHQTHPDFDVCVSDDSANENVKRVCDKWNLVLDIKYQKNQFEKGAASNSNHAIHIATHPIIKFLCQDDYMFGNKALELTEWEFADDVNWMFTTYVHTKDRKEFYRFYEPSMNKDIHVVNTLGTPSALTLRKSNNIPLFDNNLRYFYDADAYKRMYHLWGDPKIIKSVTMANYVWDQSITSSLTQDEYNKELHYVLDKYNLWPL